MKRLSSAIGVVGLGNIVVDGNGPPRYLFAGDNQAGEAKGHAVGGIWWVVGADGKKITTQPAGSGDGGY